MALRTPGHRLQIVAGEFQVSRWRGGVLRESHSGPVH